VLQYDGIKDLITVVMAMSITADSLLPRPKLDCDVGYDAAVKGASVVVLTRIHILYAGPKLAFGQVAVNSA
jgi:hypothetical protein